MGGWEEKKDKNSDLLAHHGFDEKRFGYLFYIIFYFYYCYYYYFSSFLKCILCITYLINKNWKNQKSKIKIG